MRKFKCSGEKIPMLRLAMEKKACLRGTGERLHTPAAIAAFVSRHYGCSPQEHFLTILMSAANEVLGVQEVALGGQASTPVDPKVVFSGALLVGAQALILVHNHPSGQVAPSAADVELTRQLVLGGRQLTIQVLDHVIIGRGGDFTSMRQSNAHAFAGDPTELVDDSHDPLDEQLDAS